MRFNPHSTVSADDVQVQWKDYSRILEYKRPLLEQEIEFKKSRGVTAKQLSEIEAFFKQFDKDGSNTIEKKELKACLFSLGEELTSAEVEQVSACVCVCLVCEWACVKHTRTHTLTHTHTHTHTHTNIFLGDICSTSRPLDQMAS